MQKKRGIMTWPEKRVAKALKDAGLIWKYEWEAVLNHGNGYESVRYPDFYLPEADIYIEVLSLNPTEESGEAFRKKLEFYEKNGLDYFTINVKKKDNQLKHIYELQEEIEDQVYERVLKKDLPEYVKKRFIDNFLIGRNGYRIRMGYAVA